MIQSYHWHRVYPTQTPEKKYMKLSAVVMVTRFLSVNGYCRIQEVSVTTHLF